MVTYAVFTREKTRDEENLERYRTLASASFKEHPAKLRAARGRHEVLEGPAIEDIIILEFPSYEEAIAWYHSPSYRAARELRFQGGDYRCIVTEGTDEK